MYITDIQTIGKIYVYRFTESASTSLCFDERETSTKTLCDEDWALISLDTPFCQSKLLNSFQEIGKDSETRIEGFVPTAELKRDVVQIICGVNGVCEGYLSLNSAYWTLGNSCFEAKLIFLRNELESTPAITYGDSGSWVIQHRRLCGVIISRHVGKSWAYMVPIETIVNNITKGFSLGDKLAEILLPSGNITQKALQSPVVNMNNLPVSTLEDSISFVPALHEKNVTKEHNLEGQDSLKRITTATKSQTSVNRVPMSGEEIEYLTGIKRAVVFIALCLSAFLIQLNTTMIPTVIPEITNRFHSFPDLGWYGSA